MIKIENVNQFVLMRLYMDHAKEKLQELSTIVLKYLGQYCATIFMTNIILKGLVNLYS